MENKDFVHLHSHSHFSLLDSIADTKELSEQAKKLGFNTLALTDHATVSGLWKFYKNCKKRDIKPILGCEFYVVDNADIKGIKIIDKSRKQGFKTTKQLVYHLVLLAKNYKGFQQLCKLITYAHNHTYYVPRISWEILKTIETKHLIAMSACNQGYIGKSLSNKQTDKIFGHVQYMKELFKNDYYLEMQQHDFVDQIELNSFLVSLSSQYDLPLIITTDIHYIEKNDYWVRDVMSCIRNKTKYYDKSRTKFDSINLYMLTKKELFDLFRKNNPNIAEQTVKTALDNTVKVAAKTNMIFKLPDIQETLPNLGIPKKYKTYAEWLWNISIQGLKTKGLYNKKGYQERLKEEYDLICKLKFEKYFLVVQDLVRWAKLQGIMVGLARGSSAGSLLSYCIDITSVDPIKHDLLFFRFISPNRDDLPDIDIDFQDNRRDEIKKYLEQKYGDKNVAGMITHSYLKGRVVIRDVSRVFNVPLHEVNRITKYIIQRSLAEARSTYTVQDSVRTFKEFKEFAKKYPQIIKAAIKLEGKIRHHGVHAAAIVVSSKDLTQYCGLIDSGKGKIIPFDKHDSKEKNMNILKIDVLGLNNLTIINKTLEMIREKYNKEINIHDLPLNDKKVIEMFDKAQTIGIFQFDTYGFRKLCNNMKINNFEHIVHINALARPGVLYSGITEKYLKRQRGEQAVTYAHPRMEPLLKDTQGCVLFQEQLMKILRDIGGFDWGEVSLIRAAMSKSLGVKYFLQSQEKFVKNAIKEGIPEDVARKIYEGYTHFGSWAFNRAHSVAYSLIGYYDMYLKAYYPLEFLTANLIYDAPHEQALLQEVGKYDIGILSPDINKSEVNYTIEKKAIRQGFSQIKGMGVKVGEHIVNQQPFKDWSDFLSKVERRSINKARIRVMIEAGVFRCWFPNEKIALENLGGLLKNKQEIVQKVKNAKALKVPYKTSVIKNLIDYNIYQGKIDNFINKMDNFYKVNYYKNYEKAIETKRPMVVCAGVIVGIDPKKYKETVESVKGSLKGTGEMERMYCNLNVSNGQEVIPINMKPHIFDKYKVWMLQEGMSKPVVIMGTSLKGKHRIYASEMFKLNENNDGCRLFTYPLKKYEKVIKQYKLKKLSYSERVPPFYSFAFAAVLEHFSYWITKKGSRMAFIQLSDGENIIDNIIMWPDAVKKYSDDLKIGEAYACYLQKRADGGLAFSLRDGSKIKKLKELE